ncbi:acetyltransferase (GNAT) family protein [Palleronia aestuarii]|uniref:Acetyltransferase (GNAT) family protein n=1 Tax=Palleronia aestuarii TaxID=568105 RepID=A0A2W7NT94_9RHOB|nr:GNAT family N-acetyltransferase [Palleronia aestuarii]PZX19824.1 acetyltransferase (GNAT) family protein [Palleronia aestuarii]
MIRDATFVDWPAVDRMARQFRDSAAPWIAYEPARFRRTFDALVVQEHGCALMLENGKGILMAIALPSPFSGELVAQEIMWWIEPEARGRGREMLDAYETWARAIGAMRCGVTCLDDRTANLFARRGYERAELAYRVY